MSVKLCQVSISLSMSVFMSMFVSVSMSVFVSLYPCLCPCPCPWLWPDKNSLMVHLWWCPFKIQKENVYINKYIFTVFLWSADTFCPLIHFVRRYVLSAKTFCRRYVMSPIRVVTITSQTVYFGFSIIRQYGTVRYYDTAKKGIFGRVRTLNGLTGELQCRLYCTYDRIEG